VLDVTHPDDRDESRVLGERLAAGQSDVFDVEKRYVRKDGNVVWARVTVNVIRDASGRPLRNAAVIQDISARKQAEQDLQASKDRLQLALDAARLGSFRYDPLRRVLSGDARHGDFRFRCRRERGDDRRAREAGASGRRGKVLGSHCGVARSRGSEALRQ
jgi:PAS domain-containing protein